jgi:hypothetical protein
MVSQNPLQPICVVVYAIIANGNTTSKDKLKTVIPMLSPKPGNTLRWRIRVSQLFFAGLGEGLTGGVVALIVIS